MCVVVYHVVCKTKIRGKILFEAKFSFYEHGLGAKPGFMLGLSAFSPPASGLIAPIPAMLSRGMLLGFLDVMLESIWYISCTTKIEQNNK